MTADLQNLSHDLHISVQAGPRDQASWLALARRVEAAGYEGLYVADHPGSVAAPLVALAAAASVTDWIRLGTCVVNAGVWEPIALANAVATLDVVSAGRAVLGVGAGHTPAEWTSRGVAQPSPGERVARLIELVGFTRSLLDGDEVTAHGDHFTLDQARLSEPRPLQHRVPLLVGGNGRRVLRFAATHADVVGITGAGKLLGDGHHHEVDWSLGALTETIQSIEAAAASASQRPQIEALVQHVQITDDAEGAAQRLTKHVSGATVEDLLQTPHLWVGTVEEIRDRLARFSAEFGINRYVVREDALEAVARIVSTPRGR